MPKDYWKLKEELREQLSELGYNEYDEQLKEKRNKSA